MPNVNETGMTAISPDRGPFTFHAWLELPYYFPFKVDREFPVVYKGSESVQTHLEIFSPSYKVVTGSSWLLGREVDRWAESTRKGEEQDAPRGWDHEYVDAKGVSALVDKLAARNPRYIHVEEVPAFVKLRVKIPPSCVPNSDFQPYSLSPGSGFFRKQILPELQEVIEIYRVSAYPYMRYSILPVSEALVDRAVMRFTDAQDQVLQNVHYGFDPMSSPMRANLPRPAVEERYQSFIDNQRELDPEIHFSSSYYLYRMRRWAEAVAIASSATEFLQQELVKQIASSPIEAEALNKAYRYKDLFKKVFPAFDLPNLSKQDPDLWRQFVEAKRYRGVHVHGKAPASFDSDERNEVGNHLAAFYGVSRWLSFQLKRKWNLDLFEKEKLLDPFP